MCSPKEYQQKNFRTNGVSASKNTLNPPPPPRTIFKRVGAFKTPHAIGFLGNPPAPPQTTLKIRRRQLPSLETIAS